MKSWSLSSFPPKVNLFTIISYVKFLWKLSMHSSKRHGPFFHSPHSEDLGGTQLFSAGSSPVCITHQCLLTITLPSSLFFFFSPSSFCRPFFSDVTFLFCCPRVIGGDDHMFVISVPSFDAFLPFSPNLFATVAKQLTSLFPHNISFPLTSPPLSSAKAFELSSAGPPPRP